jgi:hypothetical protein
VHPGRCESAIQGFRDTYIHEALALNLIKNLNKGLRFLHHSIAPIPVSLRVHYHRTNYSYLFQRLIVRNHEKCQRRPRCAEGGLRHTFLRHAVVMSYVNRNLDNNEGSGFPHHSRAPIHTSHAPSSLRAKLHVPVPVRFLNG